MHWGEHEPLSSGWCAICVRVAGHQGQVSNSCPWLEKNQNNIVQSRTSKVFRRFNGSGLLNTVL